MDNGFMINRIGEDGWDFIRDFFFLGESVPDKTGKWTINRVAISTPQVPLRHLYLLHSSYGSYIAFATPESTHMIERYILDNQIEALTSLADF